jgi:uncharacterized membrane protein
MLTSTGQLRFPCSNDNYSREEQRTSDSNDSLACSLFSSGKRSLNDVPKHTTEAQCHIRYVVKGGDGVAFASQTLGSLPKQMIKDR